MMTCTITERSSITWLTISGRIDSMTSPDVQRHIDELILDGKRVLVADLEQTSFVSSAGLRVFLMAQKQLKKVGGEMILYRIAAPVLPVFAASGFDKAFRIISTEQQLHAAAAPGQDSPETITATDDGVTFRYRETPAERGSITIIGSQEKLAFASYTADDVVTVPQQALRFGTGLATVGEQVEEYRHLFGEALLINRHFYFYPAVKRPVVDFMLYSGRDAGAECRFLYGFGFDGTYRYLAAFETTGALLSLDRLVQWILSLPSSAPLLGIVLLAESKGVTGMNLKQVPLQENRPADGKDIFDATHFASWINFPVDPADVNHIVAAAGLACRDRSAGSPAARKLFSREASVHLHAGIFEKGPISKNLDDFEKELARVLTELSVAKVQHLLGQSRFSNGMLGIIELEG
jgi:anti-anti-sigma factor